MTFAPHLTVVAVVEQGGRFLLIEEMVDGQAVLNQPAGHWEPPETLKEAVIRETMEESAYPFAPREVVGIYHWNLCQHNPSLGDAYLRIAFTGIVGAPVNRPLDTGILKVHWLTLDAMEQQTHRMRSPLVLQCARDHRDGRRYPLSLIHSLTSHGC